MMESNKIQILDHHYYRGRNIYSHKPVMKMVVDIGRYGWIPTKEIPGFHERLLSAFPGLRTNFCSLGYAGGFLKRLEDGTYLAHVLEHTILEMQAMLGYNVGFGRTRTVEEPSKYYLVYQYINEVCGLECGKAAVFILNRFLQQQDVDVQKWMRYLSDISLNAELGPSTSAIVEEARKREIPITRIGHESLVRLGYGKCSHLVESTLTDLTSCISADISSNKQLTKSLLTENKIPVPYGKTVYSELSAVMAASQIGLPVVVKPIDGNQGKGVSLNLNTEEEIRVSYRNAAQFGTGAVVEQYVEGKDFRVLVVGDRVCAVSERLPACVKGDGLHTIRELVDLKNSDSRRGEAHEKPLTKIHLDPVAMEELKKQKKSPDDIPQHGETVLLRKNGNLSTGGTATDCTALIHPENAEFAVRAAQVIGLDVAGVDFVTDDISQSIRETGGVIVEVNTAPGIRMHLYPSEGAARNVAKDIVDRLFSREYRFPIVSVTGTNGKTTTVRLIHHVLSLTGIQVGMTSTCGTYIGSRCVCKGDNSGPRSAESLLADKTVEAAVLETARGGIVREGLGYDLADVGVITNIADDHLGLNGIETLEDLAFVKSLVVEAVTKEGYAVLNAADAMTPTILKRVRSKVILFSGNPETDVFVPKNCIRVYEESGWIVVKERARKWKLVQISEIPVTGGGMIPCNVENCLAAVSALLALRIPLKKIAQGLKSFRMNAGRFELYRLGRFHVMLDYGHNRPGYETVICACGGMAHNRLVGVIGMPGDRSDAAIRDTAHLCAKSFDQIYVKEDEDLRGRGKGEVAGLFYKTIVADAFPRAKVTILEKETDALKDAVVHAEDGDLIVAFYEQLEPMKEILLSAGACREELCPSMKPLDQIQIS
ncbi:MAG: cyanophycin synthetase [Oscillospiraceae bacterium]|jgi:cyanophycin synthetase|nr:cyanophycin synthetase [Oscillospiraceae bacterium]